MIKNTTKNSLLVLFSLVICLFIIEGFLRIYNPFPSRVKGNKIILKANLKREIKIEPEIEGLDSSMTYTSNSLGFRGEEPPENIYDYFSILTVGGSTTECTHLTDSKTWPEVLGRKLKKFNSSIWLNNAGIDGCSTYGHIILLEDYLLKLKPNMIIFLFGINDRGRATFEHEDGFLINRNESLFRKIIKRSEIVLMISNLVRVRQAKKVNLGHKLKARDKKQPSKQEMENDRKMYKKVLPIYKERVQKLIYMCKNNNIIPVMVTQTLLFPREPLKLYSDISRRESLRLYNDITRQTAVEENVLLIDLAKQLENRKDFYYDGMHYNNKGANEVASILHKELQPVIKDIIDEQ